MTMENKSTMAFTGGREFYTPIASLVQSDYHGASKGELAVYIASNHDSITVSLATLKEIVRWAEENMPKHPKRRVYLDKISISADVMTVAEWQDAKVEWLSSEESKEPFPFLPEDGCGYWCKDGKESDDCVFDTEPEDATHVSWYSAH